mmetsp:Transcript_2932/g.11873  ORF Transcript_2932/g.11873 Transcript_2932/m.11873 type:complete len:295 (+) Transcript_2932:311-1195(+)
MSASISKFSRLFGRFLKRNGFASPSLSPRGRDCSLEPGRDLGVRLACARWSASLSATSWAYFMSASSSRMAFSTMTSSTDVMKRTVPMSSSTPGRKGKNLLRVCILLRRTQVPLVLGLDAEPSMSCSASSSSSYSMREWMPDTELSIPRQTPSSPSWLKDTSLICFRPRDTDLRSTSNVFPCIGVPSGAKHSSTQLCSVRIRWKSAMSPGSKELMSSSASRAGSAETVRWSSPRPPTQPMEMPTWVASSRSCCAMSFAIIWCLPTMNMRPGKTGIFSFSWTRKKVPPAEPRSRM